jgi:hypothetical protein
MTEARVQARHFDGFANRVWVVAVARDIEPTEHDGQRVRHFMQRAGQIRIANRPAQRRKAEWCTRTLHEKTLLCAEVNRQFFPITKLASEPFQYKRTLESE